MTAPQDPTLTPGQQPPTGQYAPPPGQYAPPPGQFAPAAPVGSAYGPNVPAGMYYDQQHDLVLPDGVVLAPVGRRVGSYFLSILLVIVTLFIGYLIWGLIAWGKGTTPALQMRGMKVWRIDDRRVPTFGIMALREIVGRIAGALFGVMAVVSFVLFMSSKRHQPIHDMVAGTVVVHDPNKVLG